MRLLGRILSLSVCGGRIDPAKRGKSPIVLVAAEGIRLLKVSVSDVEVDGLDATEKISESISASGLHFDVLLARSVPIAGFNLIDPEGLMRRHGIPSIFVLSEEPDWASVEAALRKHFHDWERRLEVIRKAGTAHRLGENGEGLYLIECFGVSPEEALRIVQELAVFGRYPEPLRVCCMVARAISCALIMRS
ncbi:MAG: DUF99 family protein [Candidatus Verstraetearchaeota archaeon]|nr:DUF99 family protein [Candidatus Verstraetearchaeota archaeon]